MNAEAERPIDVVTVYPSNAVRIVALWQRGRSTYEIADRLHVTEASVCRILAASQRLPLEGAAE